MLTINELTVLKINLRSILQFPQNKIFTFAKVVTHSILTVLQPHLLNSICSSIIPIRLKQHPSWIIIKNRYPAIH
jgi:hypothetical protein